MSDDYRHDLEKSINLFFLMVAGILFGIVLRRQIHKMNLASPSKIALSRTRRSAILAGGMILLVVLLMAFPNRDREVSRIDLGVLFRESSVKLAPKQGGFMEGNVLWHGDAFSVKFHRHATTAAARSEMIITGGPAPAEAIGEQASYSVVASGTKGAELWFRRLNVQVCVLKPGHLMGGSTPELDQLEVEAVAKRLDDAMVHGGAGVTVKSRAMGIIEAVIYEGMPLVGMYLGMGAVPLGMAVVPALLLLLLTPRIRPALGRLGAASGIAAFFLAPGAASGHGGFYIGPGYFMILSEPMMWLSILVTWSIFFGLAIGVRWWWTGRII